MGRLMADCGIGDFDCYSKEIASTVWTRTREALQNDVNEWVELRQRGRRDEFEDLPQTLWAGGLLIVNSTMLLMAQVDLNNKQQVVLSLTKEFSPPGGVFHSPCSGREELSQGDHQVRVLKQQLLFLPATSVYLLGPGSAGGGSGRAAWVYRDPALDTIIV